MNKILAMAIHLFGVSVAVSSTLNKDPVDISSHVEADGFQDLVFAIAKYENLKSNQTIQALGVSEGKSVAFKIRLSEKWKSGSIGGIQTYAGVVTFESVGVESDSLIAALARIYKTNLNPRKFASSTKLAGISLEGNPQKLKNGMTKIKLFHEDENEEKYFEIFLNIDLRSSQVWLNEKDEEYRNPIITVLGS